MRKRVRWAAPALAGALALAGCGGGSGDDTHAAAGYPMTVSNCGHRVTIAHPPKRIFAERDTSTTVAAAGAADRIVARSGEGDVPLGRYRAALGGVRQVTPGSGDPPSPETVLGTGADLVVAGHVTRKDVQALERVGLPVIVPSWFCQPVFGTTAAVDFSSTYETIGLLGRIFGTTPAAEKSISDLRRRVESVHRHFAAKPRQTAANTYIAPSLLQAYGRSSVNDAVLTTLGLRNVYADQPQRNVDVSGESLIARDPDVVVISYGTAYGISDGTQAVRVFTAKGGLRDLTAVREHRLLSLNYGYLTGGPLTVDGLETLAKQLETDE